MSWITAGEMCDRKMVPCAVYDANGTLILRGITGCDLETGEVESQVLTPDGHFIEEPEGETKRRREFFPAPLTWKKITVAEAERHRAECWDLKGK